MKNKKIIAGITVCAVLALVIIAFLFAEYKKEIKSDYFLGNGSSLKNAINKTYIIKFTATGNNTGITPYKFKIFYEYDCRDVAEDYWRYPSDYDKILNYSFETCNQTYPELFNLTTTSNQDTLDFTDMIWSNASLPFENTYLIIAANSTNTIWSISSNGTFYWKGQEVRNISNIADRIENFFSGKDTGGFCENIQKEQECKNITEFWGGKICWKDYAKYNGNVYYVPLETNETINKSQTYLACYRNGRWHIVIPNKTVTSIDNSYSKEQVLYMIENKICENAQINEGFGWRVIKEGELQKMLGE